MAVGNAVLDVMLADGFFENIQKISLKLRQKLAQLVDENSDIFTQIRGEGLMLGLKCDPPVQTVVGALAEQKLLAIAAGENVVRLLPPLIIGDAEIDDAFMRMTQACDMLRDPAKIIR